MPIQSSTYTLGAVQKDGKTWVREAHTDSTGAVIYVDYAAALATDYQSVMTARVPQINERLADEEMRAEIASDTAFAPAQNTLAQLAARIWAYYDSVARFDKAALHRLLWWVYTQQQAGYFTSAQVLASYNAYFGTSYTTTQWNNYVKIGRASCRERV